jgi:glyoxylase-like metal-dependent hydrolase (beta-lactamase superfamily II)
MQQLSGQLWRLEDSCNVYVVGGNAGAVCVDFGTGAALRQPPLAGAHGSIDVLMTHHHRDQGQGLPLAVAAGARVWAPHAEQDLFHSVDAHWQARELFNDYNMRQDRFALLDSVPLAGTLRDYASYRFGEHAFEVLPTPGHTTGSISLLAEIDGRRVAFTGDLIAAPGQVWSLAATQWTYNGGEGLAASILSLLALKERGPAMLLPAHGQPIGDVEQAIDLTVDRLWSLIRARGHNPRLFLLRDEPYVRLTDHLLWNRTSFAYSYVLLSRSGKALLFDFGYDFIPGIAAGSDRASRRPWLYTLPTLKAQFDVRAIEAVIPTHYHDDHVAGASLLRDREGTEVWAAANFADILERPADYNLPCLWYDPIAVDRVLPLGRPLGWEEYELRLHALPGHTSYAVAIGVEVDGRRVLLAGDQYQGDDGAGYNYVYHNEFAIDDYRASAALYRRLDPELILTGHWAPLWVQPGYFDLLDERGETLARLHRELLPEQALGFGAEGFCARIQPYQAAARVGQPLDLSVTVRNPVPVVALVEIRLVTPSRWRVAEPGVTVSLAAHEERALSFRVTPQGPPMRRTRVAVDITVDGKRLGQQAEALVTLVPDGG